ncbi:MAG: B12-binding domain-containing radical SAM protein [Anaerolineales bacterium]|nr:B12-binding domain-containing radical SAM protein [Anaerolineales bacterium]
MLILYNPVSTLPGKTVLPMSLLALGAVLEDKYPYEIIDGNLLADHANQLIDQLKTKKATALGMTVMPGPQLNQAVSLTKKVKAVLPDLPIIWGGYFPTQHSEIVLESGIVDFAVRSQGELTLLELLDVLEKGGSLAGVNGLSYCEGNKIIHNAPRALTPLEKFPVFPYHRLPVEKYIQNNYVGSRALDQNSSFGCPFACNFCAIVSMTNRGWLPEPAERMASTLKMLYNQYGVNAAQFHDMDFFISERRVVEFCERIKNDGLSWWALGRIDELSRYKDSTWKLMKQSGLKMVFCGAESGSDEMLERMNKGGQASTQLTLELAAKMKQYGIIPEYSFVLGNPPEPEKDIEITFNFIRKLKQINPATELILYTYTPVPMDAGGGNLYEKAVAAGFKFPTTLDEWVQPPWDEFALRRRPKTPWLDNGIYTKVRNFERVINAYYPTTTDIKLSGLRRSVLKMFGGWRYHLKFYEYPLELRALQKVFAYQRPETTGF